jgi:hypothetical protein
VRPDRAIFRQWRENAERLSHDARGRSLPHNSPEFFFLDQTTLAGTLVAQLSREQIRIQNHRYNYPLPAHYLLPDRIRIAALEDISIVHYHALFSNLYWMDAIDISEPLVSWLLRRLPLRPRLRLTRSSALLFTSHVLSRFPLRQHHHRVISRIPGIRKTVPAGMADG